MPVQNALALKMVYLRYESDKFLNLQILSLAFSILWSTALLNFIEIKHLKNVELVNNFGC